MRIAFVGKGGAGKTTAASLFTQYISYHQSVLAIDADINMHMAELFGADQVRSDLLISEKEPSDQIRTYLRGSNQRIISNNHFKKSTPPGSGSNLINITDENDWFIGRFSESITDSLSLVTVGTYSENGIASSCYHNNLAVLENVLSHMTDDGIVVVDMVAGTDAFASTLFAQFDVLFFVAEPTKRSLDVYRQYKSLADTGGVLDRLFVIGNKIEDQADDEYVRLLAGDKYIARLSRSKQVLAVDKGLAKLSAKNLSEDDQSALRSIEAIAKQNVNKCDQRLKTLWKLHAKYVQQGFVKDRFGDLTGQIDKNFKYPNSK